MSLYDWIELEFALILEWADDDGIGSDHEYICPGMPVYSFIGGGSMELYTKQVMNRTECSCIHIFGTVAAIPVYTCAVGSCHRILWEGGGGASLQFYVVESQVGCWRTFFWRLCCVISLLGSRGRMNTKCTVRRIRRTRWIILAV